MPPPVMMATFPCERVFQAACPPHCSADIASCPRSAPRCYYRAMRDLRARVLGVSLVLAACALLSPWPPPAATRRLHRRQPARRRSPAEPARATTARCRRFRSSSTRRRGQRRRHRPPTSSPRAIPRCSSTFPAFAAASATATATTRTASSRAVAPRDARSGARTASAAASASTSRWRRWRCTRLDRRSPTSGAPSISQVPVRVSDQHADAASALATGYERRWRARNLPPTRLRGSSSRSTRASTSARSTARSSQTLAANPHLKLMFGFGVETAEHDVRPFELERFVDPQARDGFFDRLQRDGAVRDYLLRLRRADKTPMWVEVTAHAERGARRPARRGAGARRQRAQAPRGSGARPLSSAPPGREARGARPDDLRRRARAEQPARDHPHVGRAAVAAAGR